MVSSSSQSPTPSYDFLISYAPADRAWGEWIGHVLEENNYTVFLEAWDIRPGHNIYLMKQEALKGAKQILIVISPDYMATPDLIAEWTSAFQRDPSGEKRTLIPVLVREHDLTGLLGPRIPITLINLDESQSEKVLLKGVSSEVRRKPSSAPLFPTTSAPKPNKTKPDSSQQSEEPPFPQEYAPITRTIRTFIICAKAKKDQDLLEQFLNSLSLLQNKGIIQTWNSNNLLAGSHRINEITKQIQQADIILPLISSDFFSDSECTELAKLAFDSYQLHDARILPVLLRPCMWKESEYRALTVLPDNQVELTKWSDRDEGLLNIVSGIKDVVDSLVLKKDS